MGTGTSLNVTLDKMSNGDVAMNFPLNLESSSILSLLQMSAEATAEEIFWMHADSSIFYVNHSACEKLQYNRNELIGKYVWEWDPLFPKDVWPTFWEEVKAAGQVQFETQHQTKFGHILPVFIRAIYFNVEGHEGIIAYVRDISEQKSQEAQLRSYQKDFEQLQELAASPDEQTERTWLKNLAQRLSKLEIAANMGTWEVDITTNQLTWSEQTRRIHEVAPDYEPNIEEAINFYKAGYDRTTMTALFNKAATAGVPWDVELTIVTTKGRERIVRVIGNAESEAGKCVRVFGVFQDITVKYGLRKELLASQKSMQDIMDHSPAAVYVKDTEGRYLFINKKFEQILKVKRAQVLGNTDRMFLPASVANEVMANDRQVIITGEHHKIEEAIPAVNGTRLYISDKFPLFNSDGEIYAVCGISTDITERRQQEEQLRRTQKMDALGKLTGGIAHDFNNLLGIILGYAGLIEQSAESTDEHIFNHAGHISKACGRGEKLTRRLLSFSRKQSLKKQIVNLNDIIQSNVDMLQKIMTVSVELQLNLSPVLRWCEVDVSDFEDALINLVLNAIHAMDHKGTLTLTTNNKNSPVTNNKFPLEGEFVQLSIEDTGCGMSDVIKEQLFEPFFTTKSDKGTGLGLSQVYGFAQRSEGFIEVHSQQGKGTRFELYFPVKSAPAKGHWQTTKPESSPLQGKGTILVVDDERELVEIASLMLSSYGYKVSGCYSGAEALDTMQKAPFNLVISDVIMPGMDGWELSRKIHQAYPETKILLVSGYIGDRGANSQSPIQDEQVMTKPFTSEELLKRVKELMRTDN